MKCSYPNIKLLQLDCYLSDASRTWIENLLPCDGLGGQHHHRCDYFLKPSGSVILRCFWDIQYYNDDYFTIITIIGPTINRSDASPKSSLTTYDKYSHVHLVVAAFSGAKTHPPHAGQPVLELALSAETSAIGVNWADRRGPSSITKYSVQIAFLDNIENPGFVFFFCFYLSQPLTLDSMRNSRSACRSRQTPEITFRDSFSKLIPFSSEKEIVGLYQEDKGKKTFYSWMYVAVVKDEGKYRSHRQKWITMAKTTINDKSEACSLKLAPFAK